MVYVGESEDGPVYEQVLPTPTKGMVAYYDNWGNVEKLEKSGRGKEFDKHSKSIVWGRNVSKSKQWMESRARSL